jgi:hypothetical protein
LKREKERIRWGLVKGGLKMMLVGRQFDISAVQRNVASGYRFHSLLVCIFLARGLSYISLAFPGLNYGTFLPEIGKLDAESLTFVA